MLPLWAGRGDFLGWGCWKPFPSLCLCWVMQEPQPQVCHASLGWLQTPQNGPRPPKCCDLPQMATRPQKRSRISKCCKASDCPRTPQSLQLIPNYPHSCSPPKMVQSPKRLQPPWMTEKTSKICNFSGWLQAPRRLKTSLDGHRHP